MAKLGVALIAILAIVGICDGLSCLPRDCTKEVCKVFKCLPGQVLQKEVCGCCKICITPVPDGKRCLTDADGPGLATPCAFGSECIDHICRKKKIC